MRMLGGAKRSGPGVRSGRGRCRGPPRPNRAWESDAFAALRQLRAAVLDEVGGLGPAAEDESPTAPYRATRRSEASVAVPISSTSDARGRQLAREEVDVDALGERERSSPRAPVCRARWT